MPGRRRSEKMDPVNEPGESVEIVDDPDADHGPTTDERLPSEPDYTGPGTYAPRGERQDWPEGHVCYIGPFGAREINPEQWKQAGVEDQPAMRWDATNQYAIPKKAFTEAALRVLMQDGGFKIT